jgi:hypothetical protein
MCHEVHDCGRYGQRSSYLLQVIWAQHRKHALELLLGMQMRRRLRSSWEHCGARAVTHDRATRTAHLRTEITCSAVNRDGHTCGGR